LAVFSTHEIPKFIAVAINANLIGPTERQGRALIAADIFKNLSRNMRKAARTLEKVVGASPAQILISAATDRGPIEIASIPFTTPHLEESAKAHRAAAAIDSGRVLRLQPRSEPIEKPEEDLMALRQAEAKRLRAFDSGLLGDDLADDDGTVPAVFGGRG
jgi:hypothetical protein